MVKIEEFLSGMFDERIQCCEIMNLKSIGRGWGWGGMQELHEETVCEVGLPVKSHCNLFLVIFFHP